ncbi:MAG: hypothetical protein NZV14_01675 [Bryobacteraceae bacterium]|nr:hypothetical protein [Bryobacteraceae bacterium]MDW8376839.1 hypothetical protein [Bryobacterales bacterium]
MFNHQPSTEGNSWAAKQALVQAAALLLLFGAMIYFAMKTHDLERRLVALQTSTREELTALRNENKQAKSEREQAVAEMRKLVEAVEAESQQAAARAAAHARRYSESLAKKVADQQLALLHNASKQFEQTSLNLQQQLSAQIGDVKQTATQTSSQLSGVAAEVASVKKEVAGAKSDLERILSEMRSVRGDLGVQSGLIATNSRELAALKALGEREYVEFELPKTKLPQRIGEVSVLLKKADPKRNRYTIEVVSNDLKVEKKDRGLNEPVQFYRSRSHIPYEIVVNEIRKDLVVGYLAAPKLKDSAKLK